MRVANWPCTPLALSSYYGAPIPSPATSSLFPYIAHGCVLWLQRLGIGSISIALGASEDCELATVALCAKLPLQGRLFVLQGVNVSVNGIELCLELWRQRRIARIALQAGGHIASPCSRSADLQRETHNPC